MKFGRTKEQNFSYIMNLFTNDDLHDNKEKYYCNCKIIYIYMCIYTYKYKINTHLIHNYIVYAETSRLCEKGEVNVSRAE